MKELNPTGFDFLVGLILCIMWITKRYQQPYITINGANSISPTPPLNHSPWSPSVLSIICIAKAILPDPKRRRGEPLSVRQVKYYRCFWKGRADFDDDLLDFSRRQAMIDVEVGMSMGKALKDPVEGEMGNCHTSTSGRGKQSRWRVDKGQSETTWL
jgi:hypothetical protein